MEGEKMNDFKKVWEKEKKNHLGDYGDSSEHDIWCAFKAGWMARSRFNVRHKYFKREELHKGNVKRMEGE